MPLDYSNPATLKFLIENFDKEQERRMIWFLRNKEELIAKSSFPENYQDIRTDDVRKAALKKYMSGLGKAYHVNRVNHRKKPLRDGVVRSLTLKGSDKRENEQEASEELKTVPCMLPIEPKIKHILYQRLPFGGRLQYLKARMKKLPEEKYNFCETTSNNYGWRLRDSELSRQFPKYGRYATFIHDVDSRSGPQPDPAYYQQPPNDLYSKCT